MTKVTSQNDHWMQVLVNTVSTVLAVLIIAACGIVWDKANTGEKKLGILAGQISGLMSRVETLEKELNVKNPEKKIDVPYGYPPIEYSTR